MFDHRPTSMLYNRVMWNILLDKKDGKKTNYVVFLMYNGFEPQRFYCKC